MTTNNDAATYTGRQGPEVADISSGFTAMTIPKTTAPRAA